MKLMLKHALAVIVLVLSFTAPVAAGWFEDAVAAHDKGDYATALRLLRPLAVHKHRNLLAHAPERLHEEVSADYTDMIYAATPKEIETRRKAFIRKWRLRHRSVADCLGEAGDGLFTFTRLPPSQWRSARTTAMSQIICFLLSSIGYSGV
jgi:hypothetical protein